MDVLPFINNTYIKGDNTDCKIIPGLPLLDFDKFSCICISQTDKTDRQPSSYDKTDDEDSDIDGNIDCDMDDDMDTDMDYTTITLRVRGCTYDPHQTRLYNIHEMNTSLSEILIHLTPEPENPVDRNAIAYQVTTNGTSETVGYVGIPHIPRISYALKEGNVEVKVKLIKRQYNIPAKKYIYKLFCTHTKIGKWKPIVSGQKYYSPL